MTKSTRRNTTNTILPPPEWLSAWIASLCMQGGPILREVVTSAIEGHPVTIGKPPLAVAHEQDVAKTARSMKRAGFSRHQIREFLMLYVRDCGRRPPRVAGSPYEEETWLAQNARLIDAWIAVNFRSRARKKKSS